jgi:hypothetical protein
MQHKALYFRDDRVVYREEQEGELVTGRVQEILSEGQSEEQPRYSVANEKTGKETVCEEDDILRRI